MATRRLKVKAMDAALVAGVKIDNVAQFCRELGVTTRTFYRHRARVEAEGQWQEHSRRPHRSPAATGAELEAWIRKLRTDLGTDNGADFIRVELARIAADTSPAWALPSRSTINRVLDRHDLLDRNPAKRPRSSWHRFAYAQPRDCYQIDATYVALADATLVAVFDVLDDCTRTLAACHAAAGETADAAIAAITQAFRAYGVPALVLSDNGVAFTYRRHNPDARSRFAETVRDWAARPINSTPYHPQTCGKVERHHQTLKKWLRSQPPPTTLAELQALLDVYRDYYNTRRPHSALGRVTPHPAWTTAPTLGGPSSPPTQTDATVYRPLVADNGVISVGSYRFSVGALLRGQTLTAIRTNNHAIVYHTNGQALGHATLTPEKKYITFTQFDPPTATHVPGHGLDTCPGT
jgi:transposase InsO family protein